jgi:hypothetical protein
MRLTYAWIVMLLMCLPAMVSAQSYQYVDANGVQQITDKLSDVPVDQRTGNITKTDILIPTGPHAESLLQTKAGLDQEYTELAEEAESLTSMAGMALAEDEFEAYTIKINQFNERKAGYEHRVKEFQEQIDALQQQIMEDVTPAKTESQKAALAENLIKAKAELDKEHSDLMKERETIVAEGQNPDVFSTTETFEAYRQKVADFNERKNDYERRAKEYQEKAEAHNKSLK